MAATGKGLTGIIDDGRRDIWRYAAVYKPHIDIKYRLTLGEGWTGMLEMPSLASDLGLERLLVKRDDLNPTGSHKARALAYQVSKALQDGAGALLISSSGNAAVAAAAYASLAGITLFALVSPKTNPVKLGELAKLGAVVIPSDRSINLAKYASRRFNIENLRPSTNDGSIEGFKSLGFEIFEQAGEVDALFTFVSSGSSLLGMSAAYKHLSEREGVREPALYATHAGALSIDREALGESGRSSTIAGNLGVKLTRRAGAVLKAVSASGGSAMLTSDEKITAAAEKLADHAVLTSPEGAASFAALMEAATEARMRSAVCVLTGHYSQWPAGDAEALTVVNDESALDVIIERELASSPAGG